MNKLIMPLLELLLMVCVVIYAWASESLTFLVVWVLFRLTFWICDIWKKGKGPSK